jgi:hypothetical protein
MTALTAKQFQGSCERRVQRSHQTCCRRLLRRARRRDGSTATQPIATPLYEELGGKR